MDRKYKIISLGGSIVIPKNGFDIKFLKNFKNLIIEQVKKGDRFIFVVGGGATCRAYQAAAQSVSVLSDKQLDWLGIHATYLNAEFVRSFFGNLAYQEVLKRPDKKINTNAKIIIASGWKPGWSTDFDAVKLAQIYDSKELVNLSNVDFVYDKDPAKFSDAIKLEKLTWSKMRQIVGGQWKPGRNVPFDPKAVKLAQKLGLKVKFIKGTDLKELKKELNIQKGKGTVVF